MADPGYIVTTASIVNCPHGGVVQLNDPVPEVVVDGHQAIYADGLDGIYGCPSSPSCGQLVWAPDDSGLRLNGRPLLTTATVGECQSGYGVPTGEPKFVTNQLRVEA